MFSPIYFCTYCHDEFDPIEGNSSVEFCSTDCEEKYNAENDDDDYTQTYLADYGRLPR